MFPYYLRYRKRGARPAPAARPRRGQRVGGGLTGSVIRIALYVGVTVSVAIAAATVLPFIPSQYNILAPLDPAAPGSPLSKMKINRAAATPEKCLEVLNGLQDARFTELPDREATDQCHIRGHVQLRQLSQAQIAAVSTTCETALRLYLWERHSLQAAARRHLGGPITQVGHQSSYNCRKIRTPSGVGAEMSSHATARAIDISSVTLADSRRFDLLTGWGNSDPRVRAFWQAAHRGACDWFGTVLGPEYNSLHADHLHLGQDRWGACR